MAKITSNMVIKVEGLNYSHFRANKSSIPALELNRLKKRLKDAQKLHESFLTYKDDSAKRDEDTLQQVRDYFKRGYIGPDLNSNLKDLNYTYADRQNLRHILWQPGHLNFYPRENVKITKDTTNKEIHQICNESADIYENDHFITVIKEFEKDIARFDRDDYYLWLCPDSQYTITVYSDDCSNAKELYEKLKAKKTLDVVFHVENDASSYRATKVDILEES